jgi:hypothetical protein
LPSTDKRVDGWTAIRALADEVKRTSERLLRAKSRSKVATPVDLEDSASELITAQEERKNAIHSLDTEIIKTCSRFSLPTRNEIDINRSAQSSEDDGGEEDREFSQAYSQFLDYILKTDRPCKRSKMVKQTKKRPEFSELHSALKGPQWLTRTDGPSQRYEDIDPK